MGQNPRILIVEDDVISAGHLAKMLRGHGYTVIEAVGNGREALKTAARDRPDLVLMDIQLDSSMDGIETGNILRHDYQIPVVYITAFSDAKTIERAKASGPFGFLLKPINRTQLVSTVEMALNMGQIESQRLRYEQELKEALSESDRRGEEVAALLEGAYSILDRPDFKSTARGLFNACKKAVGATAGYVALLSDDGAENKVLFLDSGGRGCSVDPELPMPIRGLRNEAYRTGKAVYDNDFLNSEWWALMPLGHMSIDNVLFVPITIEGRTVGLLGLANSPDGFDDRKARLANAFGEMAAVSLRESLAKEEKEQIIIELRTALNEIKTLRGIIPICSHCKKIRDDQGFWQRVEKYVQAHSEAKFSHGICPECMKKYFPELID
jgi:CheY-like chemotaxis protein